CPYNASPLARSCPPRPLLRAHPLRILYQLCDALQEPGGRGAVHEAMVEGEAEPHPLADADLVSNDGRLGFDAADTEAGALRQVEERREGVDAEHAQVGEGEGAALHGVRRGG